MIDVQSSVVLIKKKNCRVGVVRWRICHTFLSPFCPTVRRMGFNENWIMLVMKCISSVSYSVIINGTTYGHIIPSRGLKQGDPLSPYLFLLCAEGFSALINDATRNNQLHGISICRGAPKVSHLFFADDSLLFCKANGNECNKLKEILDLYESASG